MSDNSSFIDFERSTHLVDTGDSDRWLVVAIADDGTTDLLIAEHKSIGDPAVTYDRDCRDAAHEQTGPLPLEYVRRLAIAARTHRCGRPTQAGTPCRIRVALGSTCTWHMNTDHRSAPCD